LQRLEVEAQVFDNLANHIHLDAAGISYDEETCIKILKLVELG
jgi:hypothetical protein